MMNFELNTRNFVSKTRNSVFKMMNFAGLPTPARCDFVQIVMSFVFKMMGFSFK